MCSLQILIPFSGLAICLHNTQAGLGTLKKCIPQLLMFGSLLQIITGKNQVLRTKLVKNNAM